MLPDNFNHDFNSTQLILPLFFLILFIIDCNRVDGKDYRYEQNREIDIKSDAVEAKSQRGLVDGLKCKEKCNYFFRYDHLNWEYSSSRDSIIWKTSKDIPGYYCEGAFSKSKIETAPPIGINCWKNTYFETESSRQEEVLKRCSNELNTSSCLDLNGFWHKDLIVGKSPAYIEDFSAYFLPDKEYENSKVSFNLFFGYKCFLNRRNFYGQMTDYIHCWEGIYGRE